MPTEPSNNRLHALLEEVLDQPADKRGSFLDTACHDDPDLRAAIEHLLDAAEPDDDFLERPAFAPSVNAAAAMSGFLTGERAKRTLDRPIFSTGDELAGRFRIVRLIGRGGMGEVYEALDLELGTPVALKTIRAHSASDTRAVERFRREVLRARRVAHRHVCRVYDLFSHQPAEGPIVRFLTMELLEGVTLTEQLATHGAYSPEDTMRLATQVAGALDEAHRRQIVHRDLKPGNVMLVSDGDSGPRAVVTDFGLALQLADSPESEPKFASELHGGTDAYMAPEQRIPGRVTGAADIYAFGVMLHEMLTGTPPERRDGQVLLAPKGALPPLWRRAIEACLQTDWQKRPESAAAVLRIAAGRRLTGTRHAWLLAAVVMLLAAAIGVSLFSGLSRFISSNGNESSPKLVLTPITNATRETDLDAITDALRYQLTQSMFLNVLDADQVTDALRQMVRPPGSPLTIELAREVAWRRGADAVLSGQVEGAGRGYTLTIRVERRGPRPDTAGRAWSQVFEARDRAELQRIVGQAGRWVRGQAGEAAADIPKADRPMDEVTSNSWEAVSLFSRAEGLAAQSRRDDALALLAEAVRIDPEFALAHMRMGDMLMSARRLTEAADHWDKALRVLGRRQLAPREAYRIRGMYANDSHDFAEAERVYRLWLLSYPSDPKPWFYIARPLMMLGRVDEAIRMLREAQARDSYSFHIPAHLAMYHLRTGRLDLAKSYIDTLRSLGQTGWADCIQGQLDFLAGDHDAALARFTALEQNDLALLRSRSTALQAAVLAERGKNAEAIERLVRGAASDRAVGSHTAEADKLLAQASLQLRIGQRQKCRDLCIQVEQIDQSARRLALAAVLLARSGHPADAERLLARLDAASAVRSTQVAWHRVKGEILLARKKPAAAWSEFQTAAKLDSPGVPLEYLARGAAAAGERGAALAFYKRMAGDPGYYWHYPDTEFPGTWSDAKAAFARLAASARANNMSPENH